MTYVVGVDCGGTSTEAAAYTLSGHLLVMEKTGPGNVIIGYDAAVRHIKEALGKIFDRLDPSACQLITLGVAGIDSSGLRAKLSAELAGFPPEKILLSDAQLAYYSVLQGEAGILLISGTGSIAVAKDAEGNWQRAGGWGHLFGDEGSAYDIAAAGIKSCLKEYDEGKKAGLLTQQILAYFQAVDVFDLLKKSYQLDKSRLAALSKVIAASADTDPQAAEILQAAGKKLARPVINLQNRVYAGQMGLRLGLNGSVLEKNLIVRESLVGCLTEEHFDVTVLNKETSCAKAAYYIYHERM
ncbi:N-acetylglucosamine kinase [Vagococcus acidifermentans]|uniref:N-acetylglucosamine kinase n=1 Tax=Vagococcus acidifermentans TaxID=564710 RepID=UPI001476E914|nr:BadF/BadG/BcrA/BcrD ATPase family protein [Vagococcus acidifermentans]